MIRWLQKDRVLIPQLGSRRKGTFRGRKGPSFPVRLNGLGRLNKREICTESPVNRQQQTARHGKMRDIGKPGNSNWYGKSPLKMTFRKNKTSKEGKMRSLCWE